MLEALGGVLKKSGTKKVSSRSVVSGMTPVTRLEVRLSCTSELGRECTYPRLVIDWLELPNVKVL